MKYIKIGIYLFPMFLLFENEQMFNEIIPLNPVFFKLLPYPVLLLSGLFFRRFPYFLKVLYVLSLLYFLYLVMESAYLYHSFFKFPLVFTKFSRIFYVFGFYIYYSYFEKENIKYIIYLILAGFVINILFMKLGSISLGSFLTNQRPLNAFSAFLILLPVLYFGNNSIQYKDQRNLIVTILLLLILVFLNHRTIWVATVVALAANFFLLNKNRDININFSIFIRLIPIVVVAIVVVTLAITYRNDEKIVDSIIARGQEIFNPVEEGTTGNWRYMMYLSYKPYLEEYFFTGMRLKGFELPCQFYNEANQPVFEDFTGHHFHSFYLAKIFWFGLIGLILFLAPVLNLIYAVLIRDRIGKEMIILLSFIISGLAVGISYNLSEYYFGMVGLGYAIFVQENGLKGPEFIRKL